MADIYLTLSHFLPKAEFCCYTKQKISDLL